MLKSRYSPLKKILILCLLMLNASVLLATEGVKAVFKYPYVELSLTQNYSSFRETRNLLFKGRAHLLNDLINKKISPGEPQNIKFEIRVYDAVISRPQLIIRHHPKSCAIIVSGYPSIEQLYGLVAYASANKKNLEYTGVNAEEKINRFYTQLAKPKFPVIANGFTVWSKPGLSLRYAADSLQYRFNNLPLVYPANANLPIKIKDRFLVFTNGAVLVLKQGEQIAERRIPKLANADYDCNVHTDWINICDGGPQNWLYAYSYKQNKFFTNPKVIQ